MALRTAGVAGSGCPWGLESLADLGESELIRRLGAFAPIGQFADDAALLSAGATRPTVRPTTSVQPIAARSERFAAAARQPTSAAAVVASLKCRPSTSTSVFTTRPPSCPPLPSSGRRAASSANWSGGAKVPSRRISSHSPRSARVSSSCGPSPPATPGPWSLTLRRGAAACRRRRSPAPRRSGRLRPGHAAHPCPPPHSRTRRCGHPPG